MFDIFSAFSWHLFSDVALVAARNPLRRCGHPECHEADLQHCATCRCHSQERGWAQSLNWSRSTNVSKRDLPELNKLYNYINFPVHIFSLQLSIFAMRAVLSVEKHASSLL